MTDFASAKPAPPGWVLGSHTHTFSGRVGPFYFREEGDTPGVGFFSQAHHCNLGGVVHGGALMTLADMALFNICLKRTTIDKAVTVTFNAEFLAAGPIGEFIEATGEMTKEGKSLLFVRGLVTVKGTSLLSFSGTLKRLS